MRKEHQIGLDRRSQCVVRILQAKAIIAGFLTIRFHTERRSMRRFSFAKKFLACILKSDILGQVNPLPLFL
jgi:hypothetical protein